jgi:hypothetical protein
MRANVELLRGCHWAWCAQLAWLFECIGVLSREEMDICNPPDLDMVAHAVLHWAGSCGKQLLHAGATVQNTYVQCFRTTPLGEESRPNSYLRAGLRIPHSLVLSMARFRLSSHTLGVELGRHQGVGWFAIAASDVQLKECTIFLWMTIAIYSFRAQLPLWFDGSVDLHNCHLHRCRISCSSSRKFRD